MDSKPSLIVSELILMGVNGTYNASFRNGLNIIRGSMDSGKSTILHMINYCLGGSNKKILYDEVTSKVRSVFLEVKLNGKVFTLERPLREQNSAVKVYSSDFVNRGEVFPQFMSADPGGKMPDGWLSDFILEQLGIARVKIKESANRVDADEDRLSFRDIMKLMFLKQTDVGSDALLDFKSPVVFHKNVAVQKFVYNIHDERLAGLQTQRKLENEILKHLKQSECTLAKFLMEVGIPLDEFAFGDKIDAAKSQIHELDVATQKLKNDFEFNSKAALELRATINSLRGELDSKSSQIKIAKKRIEDFAKLKSTYRIELDNIQLSKLARPFLANTPQDKTIACPLCSTQLEIASQAIPEEDIDAVERSVKNKIAGLDKSIKMSMERIGLLQVEFSSIEKLIQQHTQLFDANNLSSISPIISLIETAEKAKVQAHIELSSLKKNLSIFRKYSETQDKINSKLAVISNLDQVIRNVESGLTGVDDIIADLRKIFAAYITLSGVQNVHGISYSKQFVPSFRNISYYDHLSGGVRTVMSIGMYMTRLAYALKHACNIPAFLMIDTPGQNIGRKKNPDDDNTVSDPAIYETIYSQLLSIVDLANETRQECQIIVVDNDFPDILATAPGNQKYHLVKRFQKNNPAYEKGLIHDA
ncbi:AAA family ATPase [Pseudomonas stutzeri]|uniref:AAA family ATPase n=1 Tax=Stutzerimonas stutzeri TaxID=316 RepID=UPI00190CF6BD|nr:AAA family ATPase [Stutzerimonas stutzeri]MBK3867729.1 AAA family ATPase [Stutzerimonas stutzeri]